MSEALPNMEDSGGARATPVLLRPSLWNRQHLWFFRRGTPTLRQPAKNRCKSRSGTKQGEETKTPRLTVKPVCTENMSRDQTYKRHVSAASCLRKIQKKYLLTQLGRPCSWPEEERRKPQPKKAHAIGNKNV